MTRPITSENQLATGTFRYTDLDLDSATARVRCRYDLDGESFEEIAVLPGANFDLAGVVEAAELYFLLAGVSYYKTRAPSTVDLGSLRTTSAERQFLRQFYLEGLGEFAWKNHLDLSGLEICGSEGAPSTVGNFDSGRILIPFGGGLDSIVTVAELAPLADHAALFVAERPGARFAAIENAALVSGLDVLRAERSLDPKVFESDTRGYLNGHVPVTGVLSALGVLCAVTHGYGALVMSNERSASSSTLEGPRGPINHQWSKGRDFESGFRSLVAARLTGFEYFSWLRDRSEVSIAAAFAQLTPFHQVFRSCNRNFHQDPGQRFDGWCGICDKCLFINLALAPYLSPERLAAIFGGSEPIENTALTAQLEVLCGLSADPRPFECVGDEAECRIALRSTAERGDRTASPIVQSLARRLGTVNHTDLSEATFIPERYANRTRLG